VTTPEAYDLRVFSLLSRRAAATLIIVGLAAGSAASAAESGTRATWDGTLSYAAVQPPAFPRVSKLRLRVTHAGAVVYDRAVPLPGACAATGCRLAPVGPGRPFALVDLGSKKGPIGLIWLSTHGADCCTVLQTVSIPDGKLAPKNFGYAPARLATVDGERVFLSADDRFSSLFATEASAGLPIQIWRYSAGLFVYVTRSSPRTVAADAASWWRQAQRARGAGEDARSPFAAWAADTCLLGKKATVTRQLAAAVAAGAFSPSRTETGPAGATYAAALRAHLRAWGYCS